MAKVRRVHLIAKELGVHSKEIVALCKQHGALNVANHMSEVSTELERSIHQWLSETKQPSQRRLLSVSVSGLFDRTDRHILLNAQDRVTILHGPNGSGKTTLLYLIADALNGRIDKLFGMPCHRLSFTFDDDSTLQIDRAKPSRSARNTRDLFPSQIDSALSITIDGKKQGEILSIPDEVRARISHFPPNILPGVERISADTWLDRRTGRKIAIEELLVRFGDRLPRSLQEVVRSAGGAAREKLKSLLADTRVFMIHTQRLIVDNRDHDPEELSRGRGEESPRSPMVLADAGHLRRQIREHIRRYGVTASQLDRTLPKRILRDPPKPANDEKLRERYARVIAQRRSLVSAGIMPAPFEDDIDLPEKRLAPMARRVLATYLEDMEVKLSVFEGFAKRLELFTGMINELFEYKSIEVSAEHGFRFVTSEGVDLPSDKLSSGEQHQLVLLYNLLFRVPEHALILVDEPELSLHVSWQQQVIRNFMSISEVRDLDFLIATHAPEIVYDRWDLTVPLSEDNSDA